MKVLKFGGSSIGSPEGIERVLKIIASNDKPLLVVVSAFYDITNLLDEAAELAATKNTKYTGPLSTVISRHKKAIDELVPKSEHQKVYDQVDTLHQELTSILESVFVLNDLTKKIHDRILSYGELISATIITNTIINSQFIDSRDLIKTCSSSGSIDVDLSVTYNNIEKAYKSFSGICIVPGFIASDFEGNTTTIGRGGSDYTAAIFAAALDAESLEIWTEVDGFMTADPRKVKKALAIENLSYSEAMELSHFGAKVVYSPTIQPTYTKKIPIHIKNTFNQEAKGTIISDKSVLPTRNTAIKGVSSIDDIDLITMQGSGMVGTKGTSSRLFGALAIMGINIILITQASSEYSISFAVSPLDSAVAIKAMEDEFTSEINSQKDVNIVVEKELSIIAIVGEGMKNVPGISATLFQSLGSNGINVIATAQGSSELNISVVIKKNTLKKALNVIHEGFFLSNFKELHLFIVGTGTVGSSLLDQIKLQQKHLLEEHKLKVNVIGISRSKKMAINIDGINLDNYLEEIDNGLPADMNNYVETIRNLNLRNSVLVDCTADANIANYYQQVLNSYVSVVTANKVACSSKFDLYRKLKKTAVQNNVKFMFETNVGAGLPIISTINDLKRSGDHILKLEAVLSGTLNFLFNTLSEDVPLSKAIKMAKEMGYSEPDPRIDLSGIDVIRKLVILAREAGYPMEQDDVIVKSFLPDECFSGTIEEFWANVAKYDEEFETRRKELSEKGLKWRFIAKLDNGKGEVGLETVDMLHPAYPLEGSNNILLLTTERYKDAPMVIRGYGAGADVTAAGVFADIIRVANV